MKKAGVVIACVLLIGVFQYGWYATAVPRELRSKFSQGKLEGHAVTTRPFEPSTLGMPDAVIYAWGHLRCSLPRSLITSAEAVPKLRGVLVKVGGVECLLHAPTKYATQEHLARLLAKEAAPRLVNDEVTFRAAAYAVGEKDVSLWMGVDEARSVREMFSAKQLLCAFAVQSVEIVRQDTMKGLLLMMPRGWSFEYYSTDESIRGTVMLGFSAKDEGERRLARAIIAAMRLEPSEGELSPEAMAERIRTDNHLTTRPAATSPAAATDGNGVRPAQPRGNGHG